MLEFIKRLFDTSDFPERWHCGLWSSAHGWTHIVSDWLIFGAYFTIPAILVYFVRRRRDVPFPRIFWAFGAFILFCGLGHLMESLIFWWPAYRMSALVKVCTAAASWVTVLALIPVLPRALRLPGLAQMNAKLEAEIGERTKAEASLREREAELLLALQASGMGTWRWDFPGDELRLSAETLALLRVRGEPPRRLEELMALVLEEDRAALKSALKLARTDPSVEGRFKTEFRLADPDRPMRWLEAHGRLVLDEMGRGVAFRGTMADATERKQLEMDLLQAKKLENVGHLAGGIAHDFNNLLTVIMGNAELAEQHLLGHPASPLVAQMKGAAVRGAGLTNQLLAFARKQIIQPRILDLNELLERAAEMLRPIIGERIEIVVHADRRLRRVRLDAGQFEQVVFNLAVNARDAMPDGGRLSFETANVELDEAFCRAHPELAPGPHVLLRVSDTGTGIAPDLLPHVFEPFFTTKGARGPGLGLASAYGVLRQNRGLIAVESAAGEGTTFRLYVPATGSARERPATQTILPRGVRHATLMLVEDDEGVRRMAARALLEAGYEVFEAKNGQHALEVLARFTGALDLLITDVVMPKMGGPELAQRLSAAYPDLQMLFVSGYTENLVVREGVVKDRINFLAKPFTPRQIKERVRELLARGHAASSSRLKGLDSGEPAGGEP